MDTVVAPMLVKTRHIQETPRLNERKIEKKEFDMAKLQKVGKNAGYRLDHEVISPGLLSLRGACSDTDHC
jgi:hypothetical protein